MWDSPETADVEAEAVSGNEDGVSIASEELTDGMDISDEPEQDAAETPAAENPEVTPDAEPSEAPAENPDAEPTEAPAEDPDVVEEPAEDIESPDEVPAADEMVRQAWSRFWETIRIFVSAHLSRQRFWQL